MDEFTAYRILKIKKGTDRNYIIKRHEHFVKLYRQYLMGQKTGLTSEQIEEMKEAFECLLYKRITDEELHDLYPVEKDDTIHKLLRKGSDFASFLWERHRPKIIYTVVMCLITYLIIFISNYRPVDLEVAILKRTSAPPMDISYESMILKSFKNEIEARVPGIRHMKIIPALYYDSGSEEQEFNNMSLMLVNADVYIMEKDSFMLFQGSEEGAKRILAGDEADTLEAYKNESVVPYYPLGVLVSEESKIYKSLCRLSNNNEEWIAVMPVYARHRVQAINLLKYLSGGR